MLFNSPAFALFFPVVTAAYFVTPQRSRWITLLVASSIFYMAFIPAYIFVLLGLILVDYVAALLIQESEGRKRLAILIVSLAANVGVLAVFKYYNFAADTLGSIAGSVERPFSMPLLAWALPIGLSFHTFQSMAYTIEVYRRRFPAERHLGIYALYVLFYPQLVAGPIERPDHLLPQFRERHTFVPERVVSGLKLMAWGLFKKVVIADRLAAAVNTVYANPELMHAPSVMLATVFFAFQIYCDFSGYSDIAIGAAEVMGFRLMTNFRRPYLARSIREFWARWHISLSTWFRDYVYIPLGGNRPGRSRWFANVLITFVISGLWHGANWTFVIWGALNGLYLVIGIVTAPWRDRLRAAAGLNGRPALARALQIATTFTLVSIAWVFFRARSVPEALLVLGRFADWSTIDLRETGLSVRELALALTLIVGLFAVELRQRTDDIRDALAASPAWIRWPAYYALVTVILVLGVFSESPFIYFQF
jgi:D-alanyl-lipoteichoic acid acyltransferase DltB (MBOAT superfamily)